MGLGLVCDLGCNAGLTQVMLEIVSGITTLCGRGHVVRSWSDSIKQIAQNIAGEVSVCAATASLGEVVDGGGGGVGGGFTGRGW